MPPELPNPESFPYDEFLAVQEERDQFIYEWDQGLRPGEVPVIIMPAWDMWNDNTCADSEVFLRWNLWGMIVSARWKSDSVFPHLQPWYGVGIMASAFGAKYRWEGDSAPQTRPVFQSADAVADIKTPRPGESEPMKEVLDRIRWYREVTHDRLPICLTDTQSPHDTASLLMETNEFFTVSSFEPERVERFMNAITDLTIAFSEMQTKAIGSNLSLPGHQMLCHPRWSGISLSDDNMSMVSPRVYEAAMLPYNSRISEHFGGIALHSCGKVGHNIPTLLRTPGVNQTEHGVCAIVKDSDPNPNEPESLRDGYRGSDVILKVRLNKSEIDLLDRLLASDLKCALVVTGVESQQESEKVYDRFKRRIRQITADWQES
ncbi:MAG: uroporphyrinogen decarboxylase family protein [Chloroflexota bacterium]